MSLNVSVIVWFLLVTGNGQVPLIAGRTDSGVIHQHGRSVFIDERDRDGAFAWGHIREDGKLQVLWTTVNGQQQLAVYTILPDRLTGQRAWHPDFWIDANGNLARAEGDVGWHDVFKR